MKTVAVIGSGAYGSYIIDALVKKDPSLQITLFEVGNEQIKNEKEIGYKTKMLAKEYLATSKGRFFGFGGATNKWGGGILLFTKNDFRSPSEFLKDIVDLNIKYRNVIYNKFGFKDTFDEHVINNRFFTKHGIWLGYFRRNLFRYFKITSLKQVSIIPNARVVRINSEDRNMKEVVYVKEGIEYSKSFDFYFLAAGAFESHRILLNSGLSEKKQFTFSDHISEPVFKIKGGTLIGGDDFALTVNGSSLRTNRIIGEVKGCSFFINPIFNKEYAFFQNLKLLLFKGVFSGNLFWSILKDIPSALLFSFFFFIKKKVYVYKDEWYFYIDIENPREQNYIQLSKEKDAFGQPALELNFEVGKEASFVFSEAKRMLKEYLDANGVKYEDCNADIQIQKAEDTYHPFGMMCNFTSIDDYFTKFQNMLVVNSGILPRAGGINSTAAMFPVVEEYINHYF